MKPASTLLALGLACAAMAASAAEPRDSLAQRLLACASCHGEQGEGRSGGEYYPPLAGKPVDYLFDQLAGFRDGRRHAPQMVWLLQHQSDAYLREMADHYAAMPMHTRPGSASPAQPERGQQLVREGDAGAGIAACSACHGEALTGVQPGIPALLGLPADYISAQLGAWRSGVRAARAPDCMAEIARRLRDEDVRALSDWLAAQPLAPGSAAAAADSVVLPVACGSMPVREAAR